MVGWIVLEQNRKGWRVQLERAEVRGFPLLRAPVPAPAGLRARARVRRIGRAAALLYRAGCRRVLAAADFDRWDLLLERGLRPVDAGGLSQAMAAKLILAYLAHRGCPPNRAVVALCGRRTGRAWFQAAEQLCPVVRQLMVSAQDGGAALADYLRAEYGVAVLEGGRRPDVTACFSPVDGAPEDALLLYGTKPVLGGLELIPRGDLSSALDPLALAALLWEEGRLSLEEISVLPGGGNGNPLDREEQRTL